MSPRGTYRRGALVTGAILTSLTLGVGSAMAAGTGSPGIGDPYYPTDGNGGYDVADYNVSIKYDPQSKHLDGTTVVTAKATDALDKFNLDLYKLKVQSVKVDGADAKFQQTGDHELEITPAKQLAKGADFKVEVVYGGTPEAIRDSVGKGGWQISQSGGAFAAGEPHSSTTWYPSNDHPSDKATFHLSATVPKGFSVISNGIEQGTSAATPNGDWVTSKWAEENPMTTYLTTVGIDKWQMDRSKLADGTPVVDTYAPGAENMRDKEKQLPKVLEFLSSKFGKYPQPAAGGIFLSDPINFSLELQSRPIYTVGVDMETIVHENAHEWWGDSVSVHRWKDICLNECFASYAQWMWREGTQNENLDNTYRQEVQAADDTYWSRPLVDMGPGNEFTAVYDKGQLALHALRRQIGEDAFNKVIKQWPAQHKDGNASWDEFEAFVKQVSGQKDLDGFFQQWFHGKQRPEDKYLWPGPLKPAQQGTVKPHHTPNPVAQQEHHS